MQSILFLSAALAAVPVSDGVQAQLEIIAATMNSQTKTPGQLVAFTKAQVKWRSIVINFTAVNDLSPKIRSDFAKLNGNVSGMCGNAMTPWFIANRISVHLRLTASSGETLTRTFQTSDCPSSQPPASSPTVAHYKPFAFKGLVAGQPVDQAYLRDCNKERARSVLSCRAIDGDIGNYSDLAPYVEIYDNRLTGLVYLFRRGAGATIYAAFREKYSEPCETRVESWRNGAGAALENQIVTWCFSTGKLTLRSISTDIRYGDAIYTDDFQAPVAVSPKNF